MPIRISLFLLFLVTIFAAPTAHANTCPWCGATDAPGELSSVTTIAEEDEPGKRLVLSGTVYQADGETPAPGILIYAYHTNIEGVYPTRGDETGNGKRHGYLRGWVLTDDQGHYEFHTIRPATYPTRGEPAHVHMTIKEPNRPEYWLGSVLFEGDPLITEEIRNRGENWQAPYIASPERQDDGTLLVTRDITLAPTDAEVRQ